MSHLRDERKTIGAMRHCNEKSKLITVVVSLTVCSSRQFLSRGVQ